ncbi:MAG: MFS transporter [Gammaproteobacteria bacterium]
MTTTRVQRWAYGVPGLPLAMLGLPLYVYLPTFYAGPLGVDLALVGMALLLARATDVVTDPLAGWLSDRWPGPGGRRKAPMLLGAVLLLVTAHFLFRPPEATGFGYLLVAAVAVYLGWTLITVPYTAWGAELSGDYHGRSRITAHREGWVIVGTVLAIALPAALGIADDSTATLDRAATALWLLLPLTLLICLTVVPEPAPTRRPTGWSESWRLLRANRPFQRLLSAYLFNGVANALPATLFLLFVTHVLDAEAWAGALLIAYFAAGIAGLPLWLAVARRTGKHRAWAGSMLLASAVFLTVPLLGQGDAALFLVICLLSGLGLGADLALAASLQADVVEWDGHHRGESRAGLFFGLWGMATKLGLALAVGIAFPLLDWAGFAANAANTADGLLALALLYGALPIVFKLVAIRLIWNFPLDRAALERLRETATKESNHENATVAVDTTRHNAAQRMCRHEA